MIEIQERNDLMPVCPHCSEDLNKVWVREIRSWLGRRFIYFCSNCRKTLGVSHRKGFWMG